MLLRAGRYETVRPIASGGMATVYLGRALGGGGFERLVAIKVLHPHVASEPEFVAMFLDEARLAAQIHHPNVVATLDLVQDPLFLVMEYVDGPSLHALLRACKRQHHPLPLDIGLRIFLDTLAGLHAAHELVGPDGQWLRLVHRDVSPQNVLVGSDGISRITDFGVARAESRITTTRGGALKGKLGYMSPEQVKAQAVDRRSDVYAAGAVLWEVLTGERLFKADNEAAMITQILLGSPPGPRSVAPAIPEAIEAACMTALANDVNQRYPTAAAFAEGLERAVAMSPGVSFASSRAVAALVKGLGLHQLGQGEGGAASVRSRDLARDSNPFATPLPSSSSGVRSSMPGVGSGLSASSPGTPPRRSLLSLADVLEPQSATTGVGGVVAEPPQRKLVGRSTLIAAAMIGALSAVVVAVLITGGRTSEKSDRSAPTPGEAAPQTQRPAAPTIPAEGSDTSAGTGASLPATGSSTAPVSPSPSTSAAASATAQPRTPPKTQTQPRVQPRTSTPNGSPTTFRPREL
ncbi:serine/threonine-protein kinase [Chondromyces apiculatus]|uniref:serine/threonine-protein kinase n=1 Tax=Chondromyces apiculatus TaxID=51 RepID=UPI001E594DF0|nr:serine/threonine-protein kinase [Chondromyces apiculatus]